MGRKKKVEIITPQVIQQTNELIAKHNKELETNLEYSLDVDPENKYNLSEQHRQFIKLYTELKNLPLVTVMMNIEPEVANSYFISYASQQEIRRINRAMLQRRFQSKMLTIDQISGYLTTLLTEENVPLAEQLKPRDKVAVAGMLIELNKFKAASAQNPDELNYKDVEKVAQDMSIDAIRTLLAQKQNNTEKDNIISQINKDNVMLPEEIDYLKSLSVVELMQMLNAITKH